MPDETAPMRDTMRRLRDDAHEQQWPTQLVQMYGMRAVTLSLEKLTGMFKRGDEEKK